MERLVVTRKEAVELLEALGRKNAKNYSEDQTQRALEMIEELGDVDKLRDPDLQELYHDIAGASRKDRVIDLAGFPRPTAVPLKTRKIVHPDKIPKRPGVCAAILACLFQANEHKPVTKEQVLAVLVAKFGPGTVYARPVEGMKKTVDAFPCWVLADYKKKRNIRLHRKGRGYWAEELPFNPTSVNSIS